MQVEELGFSEWEDGLPAKGFDVFHLPEALRVIDRHTSGNLHLFGGYQGNELVGLCPVHLSSQLGVNVLTSPPLGFGIGRLGPVIMSSSPKQRKRETINKRFVRGIIETTNATNRTSLVRFACSPTFSDPRPFKWNGFDITPQFTYCIDLANTSADEVLMSFSRDLRREIRNQDEVDFTIRIAGADAAEQIIQSMAERFKEQGLRNPLSWDFVGDLINSLENRVRVYAAESAAGEFISGMIILYSNETAYFWKGGTKVENTDVSPNSLLHWQVIEDILTDPNLEEITKYDLYSANNERLVGYKSGFGGSLNRYYVVESNSPLTSVAKGVYRMYAYRKHPFQKNA